MGENAVTCAHCGQVVSGRLNRRRHYCDGSCRRRAAHARQEARAIERQLAALDAVRRRQRYQAA